MQKEKLNRKNRGITLVALVITIIVMLILVGVSVTVALNGGLFSTAKQAADGTQIAVDAEKTLDNGRVKVDGIWYDSIEDYINKKPSENQSEGTTEEDSGEEITGIWQQDGNEIKYVTEDGVIIKTLSVGDKVNYDETKEGTVTVTTANMEWRILGVNDEGQVELISTIPTAETVTLEGKEGYLNAVTLLDTACSTYGQGTGAASARSLTAEDINKLGNYDPTTYENYGTKYTYKYYNEFVYGIVSASITDENRDNVTGWTNAHVAEYYTPDWTISSSNVGPYELENTFYYYTVANQITMTDPVDMATLITKGEGGTSNVIQWLASLDIKCYNAVIVFGPRTIYNGTVTNSNLWQADGYSGSESFAVRPVVSLESSIQLKENSEGVFEIKQTI